MPFSLATACCPTGTGAGPTGWPIVDWFAGDGRYQTLYHCMGGDHLWIAATVTLDVVVAAGYLLIAKHWWVNERTLPDVPARRALRSMRNIFLFCGLCGYAFIPVKMFWPAWRLYDVFMLVLGYFTWKYAWGAKDLKVIYAELGKNTRLQAELDKAREDSKQKSFFLNAISHDLRTPLNGLTLQASLAEIHLAGDDREELRQSLLEIKASARATGDMLDALLEFARLDWASDPVTPNVFPLAEAVESATRTSRAAAEQKGLDLRNLCPAGLTVTTDRLKLERVLTNLIANAVKFTPTGSVRVEAQPGADGVELHVIDTGVGIAPEHRDRLFEEFFQVHNHERDRRKGFGLGLSIARRLARQLGGDIQLDSAPGRGSRFTVVLPGVLRGGDADAQPRPRPAALATAVA
ncbi:MAG TPA: HAMP domain-containing sensor histidine kinase [Humisphaera sp.]